MLQKNDLIDYFYKGIKDKNNLKIGVEHEKFVLNKKNFKQVSYDMQNGIKDILLRFVKNGWAPKYDNNIQEGERAYFTHKNAEIIDKSMYYINNFVEERLKPYLLGPLLVECSIHNNTNGQFSAFFKEIHLQCSGICHRFFWIIRKYGSAFKCLFR